MNQVKEKPFKVCFWKKAALTGTVILSYLMLSFLNMVAPLSLLFLIGAKCSLPSDII